MLTLRQHAAYSTLQVPLTQSRPWWGRNRALVGLTITIGAKRMGHYNRAI